LAGSGRTLAASLSLLALSLSRPVGCRSQGGRLGAGLGWPDLLDQPSGAVGVAEREERVVLAARGLRAGHLLARLEMEDLADVHPAPGQLGAGGLDVGDDQVQARTEPGTSALRMSVIEQADPGGVSCTTRKSSPELWSTSS